MSEWDDRRDFQKPEFPRLNADAISIVKQSYDYPQCAWETRYAADIGKRKLLNVLRYLANPDRYERPKNRVYRSNRPEVNNLWDVSKPPIDAERKFD